MSSELASATEAAAGLAANAESALSVDLSSDLQEKNKAVNSRPLINGVDFMGW